MNKICYYYERLNSSNNNNIQAAPSIEIDLTNRCSKNCYYCNSSHIKKRKDLGSFNDYINLIDSLPKTVKTITFAGGGEPMERSFAPMVIHHALTKGFKVGLITTGNHLDKLVYSKKYKLSWVGVDIDSGNSNDYSKMGKGNKFPKLIDSLKTNIKKLNNLGIVTTFKYLVNDYNNSIEQVNEAIKLSKELEFQEFFVRVALFNDKILKLNMTDCDIIEVCNKENVKYNISFIKYKEYIKTLSNKKNHKFCYAPLITPLFAADGNIYWCCEQRGKKKYKIGDWILNGYSPLLSKNLLDKIENFKQYNCNSYCRYLKYNKFVHKVFTNTLDSKSGHELGFF